MVNEDSEIFFRVNAGCEDKVKKLQSVSSRLEWEHSKCSHDSPGPVKDHENVYRQAPSPVFYNEQTGKLLPTAFGEIFNRGCSVDREQYASLQEIHRRGLERTESFNKANPDKPQRVFSAVAKLACDEIRSHKLENNERSMAVYDTALPENPSHAEICVITTSNSKMVKRSIRAHLFNIAKVETLQVN